MTLLPPIAKHLVPPYELPFTELEGIRKYLTLITNISSTDPENYNKKEI
jgi:hypothetical protein